MHSYQIIKVKENELEQCKTMIRLSFSTVAKEFHLTEENCPSNGAFIKTERLISNMKKGNLMYGLYYVAELIGFFELEEKISQCYELKKLSVLPRYRHKGYGTILLDYPIKVVGDMQGKVVQIGIMEGNDKLKKWYLDYGFIYKEIMEIPHLPFSVGYLEKKV